MKNILFVALFLLCQTACIKNEPVELWYKEKASTWTEALPIGNGRLGAMIFGDPFNEIIQLNEETIWAGSKINNNNPEAISHLATLRQAIFEGRIKEAEQIANSSFLGTPPRIRSYQPLGDLTFAYGWKGIITDYRRSLDLRNGVAAVSFMVNEKKVTEQVFASAADNVIVIRITSQDPENLNCILELKRDRDAEIKYFGDGRILLTGQIADDESTLEGPGGNHMRFAAEARVMIKGGGMSVGNNGLKIDGAEELMIVLSAASDYNINLLDIDPSIDPAALNNSVLDRCRSRNFSALLKRHSAEHSAMFDRVRLHLGSDSLDVLP
jgi:alpha-L-fucosidase 2